MWIGVPAGTPIVAFATGIVAQRTAPSVACRDSAAACTIFQFSPLPQMNAATFKIIAGGMPVQMVIVNGSVWLAGDRRSARGGATLATAPAGTGSTACLAFVFQDRLCRDPLSWAEAIAASGACDSAWPQFVADLAALPERAQPARAGSSRRAADDGHRARRHRRCGGADVTLTIGDGR